ncbi:MAG: MFS transporter [candidate division Zixibacteria bacterium]|nr:MFS transporter [candidate division Zixibacteria bacterium]
MLRKGLRYVRQFDKNLWILSLGWLVSAVGYAVSLPFIAIYFNDEFGLSMTDIGLFFGVVAVARSVFQTVGGEISDRVERRRLLVYSQYSRAIAFLGMSISIYLHLGLLYIAGFLLLNSILGAIFQPVANAMVSDILPKKQRLEGYAIVRSAGNFGWALGPAIGGFIASSSYDLLFLISSGLVLTSGTIMLLFLAPPRSTKAVDRFKFKDIIAIRKDSLLAIHMGLLLLLYLVVAQLIVPFSTYTVNMAGISETQLGYLFTLNGLLVVGLQLPATRLLSHRSLTSQLAIGSLLYAFGYGMMGSLIGFGYFAFAITVVTIGEVIMSPPSLTLTSRLAPAGRMGRYMGIHGFFLSAGWSLGPLYGGVLLDTFHDKPSVAWILISSLAMVSFIGYLIFQKKLPREVNIKEQV